MSRLDDLKHALAKAGHSPEEITQAVQDVIIMASMSWKSTEQIARDALAMFYLCGQFKESMEEIMYGPALEFNTVNDLANAIRRMAEETGIATLPPTKPTEKTPYYHKDKQKWWQ
jgi:hypothetical protein